MELFDGSLTQSKMMIVSLAKLGVCPDTITVDIDHGTDTITKSIVRGWYR
jgi:precorrin-6B methylase 2